ncbi:MAG TPA: bifunctional 4-hydroxy-2-oxoglutarate aldolase/2-dehydro-3-deoxy-phosphogluconate aldolase [Candidatus Baltobacteraceae bacterium]|nr:bifunctional 4-hydroxy-2-oxoglutarate aldolase/2-dehydro-3-deoxy-phosphogluconate aldolase [Candidatus Baltobacteraceae bacterium]
MAPPDLGATLTQAGVLPVVTVARPDQAVPLAEALLAGGLACVEITFRSDAAVDAIRAIRAHVPAMLVGAGTVLTTAQADAAVDAGAAFLVSPGLGPDVVDHVLARGVPMLPGIATPTELQAALRRDLRVVKVFPAAVLGGPAFLQALAAPYPMMRFVPTGGVTAADLAEYLALDCVAAVGGTWLARPATIASGAWDEVERLAREAAGIVQRVRGAPAGAAA